MTDPEGPPADPGEPRDLATLAAEVPWPEPDAERAARSHRLPIASGRPVSPFGELAATAEWLAGVQGAFPPHPPRDARLVVVTARHRGTGDGRTLDDPDEAAAALAAGRLPLHVLAADLGVRVETVDAGEVGDPAVEDAADLDATRDAIEQGAGLAEAYVDDGADLLVLAALSPGGSTTAAAVVAVVAMAEPVLVAGRGSGLDDAGWSAKTAAVRDARRRGIGMRAELAELLATVGGRDIALLAGLLLGAAGRRVPVLLDGPSAVAAALVARDGAPRITRWVRLAHAGTDLGEVHAVARLGTRPLVDVGLTGVGVTAGVGGLLGLARVRAAAALADAPLSLARPAPPTPQPDSEPATASPPAAPPDPEPDGALEPEPDGALEPEPDGALEPEPEPPLVPDPAPAPRHAAQPDEEPDVEAASDDHAVADTRSDDAGDEISAPPAATGTEDVVDPAPAAVEPPETPTPTRDSPPAGGGRRRPRVAGYRPLRER